MSADDGTVPEGVAQLELAFGDGGHCCHSHCVDVLGVKETEAPLLPVAQTIAQKMLTMIIFRIGATSLVSAITAVAAVVSVVASDGDVVVVHLGCIKGCRCH